jgi:hypothetical protein
LDYDAAGYCQFCKNYFAPAELLAHPFRCPKRPQRS